MGNGIPHQVQTLQVTYDPLWFHKRPFGIPALCQQHPLRHGGPLCDCLPCQYSDLLQQTKRSQQTLLRHACMVLKVQLLCKALRASLAKTLRGAHQMTPAQPWQGQDNQGVATAKDGEANAVLARRCQLPPPLCKRLLLVKCLTNLTKKNVAFE